MAQFPSPSGASGRWQLREQRRAVRGDNWTTLNSFESIASYTAPSGGSNGVITFSSIPQIYKHLHIRGILRSDRASTYDSAYVYFNSDQTLSNYTLHGLRGDGSTASSFGYGTAPAVGNQLPLFFGNSPTSQMFGIFIMDVLDYTDTNKYKVTRAIGGCDYNGGGTIDFVSSAWINNTAITSITFKSVNATEFLEYSSIALYGVRG
jgi:hypothetical protein